MPLIEARNISRRFPGVIALNDVSLNIEAGQVHILAGENGAGKSTLVKILTGAYAPSSGSLRIGLNLRRSWPVSGNSSIRIKTVAAEVSNWGPGKAAEPGALSGRVPEAGAREARRGAEAACRRD